MIYGKRVEDDDAGGCDGEIVREPDPDAEGYLHVYGSRDPREGRVIMARLFADIEVLYARAGFVPAWRAYGQRVPDVPDGPPPPETWRDEDESSLLVLGDEHCGLSIATVRYDAGAPESETLRWHWTLSRQLGDASNRYAEREGYCRSRDDAKAAATGAVERLRVKRPAPGETA